MANKIDSNVSGLRYAEESSLGVLPGTPTWFQLEPNSYKDFGGKISTTARNPISASRQRKKGVVTDLEANGGFNQDLTFGNTFRLLQSFFFAAAREKFNTQPLNGNAVAVTSVTASSKIFAAASGFSFLVNSLVFASGFNNATNNGLKVAAAATATALTVSDTCVDEASPPSTAKLEVCGYQFPAADASISMSGSLVRLNSAAITMTTLGLIAGEWIFLGSDTGTKAFVNNTGWARISVIGSNYLEFDKVSWTAQAETSTGKTIQIFFGNVLKNESAANLITRRSVQLERTLGADANGTMSEYIVGAVANELTINCAMADKVSVDMGFIGIGNEQRTGTQGVKAGNRPTLATYDAFNTSSDFSRIKLSLVDKTTANVTPLFAFGTELKLTIKNHVSPTKALGTLGAFDTSAGTFDVSGKITAYFADVTAVQSVRNNSDVTVDFVLAKNNTGLLIDVPLLALGDGRLAVDQDKPITLPLDLDAAESPLGHTLLAVSFPYLPTVAC